MTLESNNDALWQAFAELPEKVYADDAYWLGEDLTALQQLYSTPVSKRTPALWLDCIPGEARLAASFAPTQEIDGKPTAFFGYWEGSDNTANHRDLFQQAEDWARQQGAQQVLGPINLSTFNAYRVRLNHFDSGAFPGEPYNPPYYAELLEQLGYRKEKTFHSWLGPLEGRVAALSALMEPVREQLESEGLTFSLLTPEIWLDRLDAFYDYVDQIFGNNYAYTGIRREAFIQSYGPALAKRLCPNCSVLVTHQDDSIAGFFLGFPDYGPISRAVKGQIRPISELGYEDFLNYDGRRLMLGKSGGVHPDYRQKGLFGLMAYLMMKWGGELYNWAGAVMVREDNPSARTGQLVFNQADDQRRDYALYLKEL